MIFMTFSKWVNSLPILNIPEGDLVFDIQHDENFPQDINSWEELSNYLPDDERIQEIARNLFQSYLTEIHHHN
jgi:uncharacterized protein YozE (UPF0346 family)